MRLGRSTVIVGAAVTGALTLTANAFAQSPEITTIDLGSGLHLMLGQGGNIGLSVGDDGTFMIDDQFAPLTEAIQAAIAEITDQPVSYVINTHWHGDHTGGNENFANAGATVFAHENVRKRMGSEQVLPVFGRAAASPPGALPTITFSEDATFHLNGQDILAIHVPNAHTDGDMIIHFPNANVIHAGDVFFKGIAQFIDHLNGGTIDGIIAAQDLMLELADDDTQIIPGHGPLATRADLVEARATLVSVRDAVKPLVDQGLAGDAIVSREPLSGLGLTWSYAFFSEEQFVELVAASLGGG